MRKIRTDNYKKNDSEIVDAMDTCRLRRSDDRRVLFFSRRFTPDCQTASETGSVDLVRIETLQRCRLDGIVNRPHIGII